MPRFFARHRKLDGTRGQGTRHNQIFARVSLRPWIENRSVSRARERADQILLAFRDRRGDLCSVQRGRSFRAREIIVLRNMLLELGIDEKLLIALEDSLLAVRSNLEPLGSRCRLRLRCPLQESDVDSVAAQR